ncbi:Bug family tripartite tricarboxylate transporter substrate binding protein [Qaidamihabitans albus]|uniref:Bug family tripartite tricarboxylate transporter substrate binding protein n=1 Tax=Qaidamihabitans albus TaxID=2795733 RepID=UPI0018F13B5C|nr:tripartite tricarboxylate transporter substrate binding protein [Qaidamihabitans albus]
MAKHTASRAVMAVALASAGAFALTACGTGSGSTGTDVPDQITLVVPTSAGGGVDTAARQLQPYLEEELGSTIAVINREGGATTIGTASILQSSDCSTILITAIPHINLSYLAHDVDYDLVSFAAVGGVSTEPGVIRVAKNAPWDTLRDLVNDAKARPGEITFSVSEAVSSNSFAITQIEEATGADFNVVPFDGGGPARLAVVSGEVDATHAGAFNSLPIAEDTKVLAVHYEKNRWGPVTDDAPTVNKALGVEVPNSESTYNIWTSTGCAKEHPERYQALVDALDAVVTSDGLKSDLKELGEALKLDPRTPEAVEADAKAAEDQIRTIMTDNPDLFKGE